MPYLFANERRAGILEGMTVTIDRTYEVKTFGCQMNVHDSERMSGSLESAGYARSLDGKPDVLVINTCAVRENAADKLYGTLGSLAQVKRERPGFQIAVGGCLAQEGPRHDRRSRSSS